MKTLNQINPILKELITSRSGNYCHFVEVSTVYELENIANIFYNDFIDVYNLETILDFLETLQIYFLPEEEEINQEEE